MHGDETEYKVWISREIKTYDIREPITTYLNETPSYNSVSRSKTGFWRLFAVVTSSAFLDGLNPCAFAVLLFFIGFLFTIKQTRAKIWQMGLIYVGAIYLAYFLIGIELHRPL